MRICLSFLAMTNTAPLSLPFWPIFQASATRSEYSSMVSGLVVGTIRTASWLVVRASQAASLASNACRSPAESVPVTSVTRAESAGTGCSPSRGGSHATALAVPGNTTSASTPRIHRRAVRRALLRHDRRRATVNGAPASAAALLRRRSGSGSRLAEIDRRRHADALLVLDREVRLDVHLEQHGREVGRERAHRGVEFLHRLDIAVARHRDAVLRALELRLQV